MRTYNEVYEMYEYATDNGKTPGEAIEMVYGVLAQSGFGEGMTAVILAELTAYEAIRNIPNTVAEEVMGDVCQYLKKSIANNRRFRVIDQMGVAYVVDEDGNVTLSGPA